MQIHKPPDSVVVVIIRILLCTRVNRANRTSPSRNTKESASKMAGSTIVPRVVEVNNGVPMFCTTAGAQTAVEEVPLNPLADQVNPRGFDPEETDSDLDTDDEVRTPDVGGSSSSVSTEEKDTSEYEVYPPRRPSSTRKGRKSRSISTTQKPGAVRRDYRSDLAGSISVRAPLPACDIGAVEFLTFFPNHTQWPEAGLRLLRNKWSSLDIAKAQLHARGKLNKQSCERRADGIKHQVLNIGREFFNDSSFKLSTHSHLMQPVISYDASGYRPRASVASLLPAASLIDISEGIVNWPVGQDRGTVTQAIEYAHQVRSHCMQPFSENQILLLPPLILLSPWHMSMRMRRPLTPPCL